MNESTEQAHATIPADPRPGWYFDSELPGTQRYWDGSSWTALRARPVDELRPRPSDVLSPLLLGAYLLWGVGLLGLFGVHQFYLGNRGRGVLLLSLTVGGSVLIVLGAVGSFLLFPLILVFVGGAALLMAFVLWLVDLFTLREQVRQQQARFEAVPVYLSH